MRIPDRLLDFGQAQADSKGVTLTDYVCALFEAEVKRTEKKARVRSLTVGADVGAAKVKLAEMKKRTK